MQRPAKLVRLDHFLVKNNLGRANFTVVGAKVSMNAFPDFEPGGVLIPKRSREHPKEVWGDGQSSEREAVARVRNLVGVEGSRSGIHIINH